MVSVESLDFDRQHQTVGRDGHGGLFALGEEIGWRGFLVRQLAPLGNVKANIITGILWGLWHAPIILMGYNFPGYPVLGILFMCVFTTALSFLLSWVQKKSHSTLASAVVHGTVNGYGSFLALIIAGAIPLFGGIVGLVGAAAILLTYLLMKALAPDKPAELSVEVPAEAQAVTA